MSLDVQLQHVAAIPLAVVRRTAASNQLPRIVPECCGLVWTALRSCGLKGGRHVAIYWDTAILVDIGAEVGAPFAGADGVVPGATPAGLVASAVHFGPYQQLGTAHRAIRGWCRDHGHDLAGPNWEIYGHWQPDWDAHPERIRTDVFYLVLER